MRVFALDVDLNKENHILKSCIFSCRTVPSSSVWDLKELCMLTIALFKHIRLEGDFHFILFYCCSSPRGEHVAQCCYAGWSKCVQILKSTSHQGRKNPGKRCY